MYIVTEYTRSNQRFIIPEYNNYPCPKCEDGCLNPFDYCKRILKHEGGDSEWCEIPRHQCNNPDCEFVSRMLPPEFVPYKHYGSREITDVLSDVISPYDEKVEYPCTLTMELWLLWLEVNITYMESMMRSIANRRLGFADTILQSERSIIDYMKKCPDYDNIWLTTVLRCIYNAGGTLQAV